VSAPLGPKGALAIVRADQSGSAAFALRSLGEAGREALADGRVFHGGRRVEGPDEPIFQGDELVVYRARTSGSEWSVPDEDAPSLLAERDGVLAAYKPARMPTIPDHKGVSSSLLSAVAEWTGGTPRHIHPTSRLDVGVSGVVLFAITEEARRRLADARASGAYSRRYVAVASAAPNPECGLWDAPIGRARDPRHRAVRGKDATPAATAFVTVARAARGVAPSAAPAAMLAVVPLTGRTHQIRLHASHAGAPLLGDPLYGGPARIVAATGATRALRRIALHAARVTVPDARGALFSVDAPFPGELAALWESLGGTRESLAEAVSIVVPAAT
jgi:23S rRNA pseudouridine955/2504/2580 synthase/23S rRNA pseudouridine1911/1915/1917 synthase